MKHKSYDANPLEIKVLNYIIKETLKGKTFDEIDTSFVGCTSVRGKAQLWQAIMGQIRKQLQLNPNDIDGFSVTPKWVRNVYQAYRQSDYHDCWQPGKINLESVENLEKDVIRVVEPIIEEHPIKEIKQVYIGYRTFEDKANQKISIIPFMEKSEDFYKGYLKAKHAKEVFRITLEEINDYN